MWKQTQRSPEEEIDLREGRKTKRNKKNKKTKKTKKNKQNIKKQKKEENQENQEDLLGQSASDIGLFFFAFVVVFFFSGPKGRMQRVESFHAPREGCRELSLVMCFSSCHYVKTENV